MQQRGEVRSGCSLPGCRSSISRTSERSHGRGGPPGGHPGRLAQSAGDRKAARRRGLSLSRLRGPGKVPGNLCVTTLIVVESLATGRRRGSLPAPSGGGGEASGGRGDGADPVGMSTLAPLVTVGAVTFARSWKVALNVSRSPGCSRPVVRHSRPPAAGCKRAVDRTNLSARGTRSHARAPRTGASPRFLTLIRYVTRSPGRANRVCVVLSTSTGGFPGNLAGQGRYSE